MKKQLLTLIAVLIMIFSAALGYHMLTKESNQNQNPDFEADGTIYDVSSDLDDLLIEENDEINIGEMI